MQWRKKPQGECARLLLDQLCYYRHNFNAVSDGDRQLMTESGELWQKFDNQLDNQQK